MDSSFLAQAARIAGAPVAFLGSLDADRERVQSSIGWKLAELPLASSFAARVADQRDVIVVGDASQDARFAAHPLVAGAPNVRFIACVPLADAWITLLDRAPRLLSPEQIDTLRFLGRAAEQLDEANDRFREFFEQTDDLVMSFAPNGTLLHANHATLQTLGFTREELARSPVVRVIDPDARDAFRAAFAEVFASGETRRIETVFVTAAGRRITVEGSLRPRVIDGRAVLARVIFRDISDRKQFEAELGSARDAALEAARLKTQFLTNVSHEIRTPMNGIVGMVDLLLSTPLTVEQQDYAHQARASAEQLLSIVNNILYVSNIEAGGLASSQVDFDLYRTLQRIVEVMKIGALGKDLDVALVWDQQLPPIFRGNQSKLRQVVTNLMENAVKFTEEGSVTLSVSLQTETETHRVVRFEVRDSGIGISEEDRLLLFERFSQIEAGSTRRFQGVGLGLATARHLVETLGGLIDVESKPGVGSTFWFSVPFPKQTGGRKPIASSDLEFRGKRVLLLDGYPTSRKIVRHYLETTWEMRVSVAEDAATALAMLRAEEADPFRVVLFDCDPKVFAGIKGPSLVYLHGGSDEPNEEALRAAGVNAYAKKPVGQGELFDAMTVALAHDAIPLARVIAQPFASRGVPPHVTPEMKQSLRVLLAEDNFLNRKLTMSQLEKLGYRAEAAANGREVIEMMARQHYDVILMDCQMPIVDGYQATMEVRRREKASGRRTRIIAMTANALEGDREKCLAAGMDDYLAKPTRADELEVALAHVIPSVARDLGGVSGR